jgi:hypothetical protein
MRVIYLASAIRPKGDQTLRGNINYAKKIALELWAKGFAVFCPAANTDLPHSKSLALGLPEQQWLDADLEILMRCDAVVVAPNWEQSIGVKGEIAFAEDNDIPVFYYPNLPPEVK